MKVRFETREMPDGRGLLTVGRRRMAYPSPEQAQAAKDVWRHAVRSFATGPHAFFGDLDRRWKPCPDEGPTLRMSANDRIKVRFRNRAEGDPFVLDVEGARIGYQNLYTALKAAESLDRSLSPAASDRKFGKAMAYAGLAVGAAAGGAWTFASYVGLLAASAEAGALVAAGGFASFSGAGGVLMSRAKTKIDGALRHAREEAPHGDPGYELMRTEPERVEITREEPRTTRTERPRPAPEAVQPDTWTPAEHDDADVVEAPGQDAFAVNLRATVECESRTPSGRPNPSDRVWRPYDVDCFAVGDRTHGTVRCETTVEVEADTPEEAIERATANAPALRVPGWDILEKSLWADPAVDVDHVETPKIAV